MTEHKTRQYSDQLYCKVCGKTWDINDLDPPPCIDHRTECLESIKKKLKGEDDE